MILLLLLLVPLAAGLAGWGLSRRSPLWPRVLSLAAMAADLAILTALWIGAAAGAAPGTAELPGTGFGAVSSVRGAWLVELRLPWVPALGLGFHLAMDGLSLLLALLTAFLGVVSVLASWRAIRERVGLFHLNLLLVLAGVLGVFLGPRPAAVLLSSGRSCSSPCSS